jgi:hypothetical protein
MAFGSVTEVDEGTDFSSRRELCTTMKTSDVTETLDLALQASGCDQAHVEHKPRLLSDNGSSYVSGELAEWLGDKNMGFADDHESLSSWNTRGEIIGDIIAKRITPADISAAQKLARECVRKKYKGC